MRMLLRILSPGIGRWLIILLVTMFQLNLTYAQSNYLRVKVYGKVLSAINQQPLPQANISISEIELGTMSNSHGNYSLYVKPGEYQIELTNPNWVKPHLEKIKIKEGGQYRVQADL